MLEKKLEKIDRDEVDERLLASSRSDTNEARRLVLMVIHDALADYGCCDKRYE
jgi:hypothetical protein